jgi:copper transport protein
MGQRRNRVRRHPGGLRGLTVVLTVALLAALAGAPAASAHAQLLGSSPASGSTVPTEPREVIFKFDQAVGGTLGAVRVFNAKGEEVDDVDLSHPEGHQRWLGVGLKPNLPDGTYTATYRAISADTHIVYGGLVFNLGHAGPRPKFTVAGLIARNEAGRVTRLAFGVVRALDYLSIALLLGGLAFLVIAWVPARSAAAGDERWPAAANAFATRVSMLLGGAAILGMLVSVLGVALQGATAAGVSLWSSLTGTVIQNTLESRFGEVWGLRALDWVALAGLLAAARRSARWPPPAWIAAGFGLGAAYLAITPALAGHASIESPVGVFLPSDVLHVLAASVWVGGIAFLLLALPAATRRLHGPERSRLLLAVLSRFSPLALTAVLVIAATGVVQAYIDVRSLDALLHSTYGTLILVKTALLAALIVLGWVNRSRVIPALRRVTAAGEPPAGTGVLARRTLRGELVAMACVLGVTAALISYAPPVDLAASPFSAVGAVAANGTFSINTSLGPAELEMSVEPARVGPNTIHVYLFDARTGAQFTATKELTVTASLPAKAIGPLPLQARISGPGHYTLAAAELSPGGTWSITLVDRVSEFEEYTRTVKVPIN